MSMKLINKASDLMRFGEKVGFFIRDKTGQRIQTYNMSKEELDRQFEEFNKIKVNLDGKEFIRGMYILAFEKEDTIFVYKKETNEILRRNIKYIKGKKRFCIKMKNIWMEVNVGILEYKQLKDLLIINK